MGMLRECNACGHEQMIGHNPVDGRLQWWTQCESCGEGDFMSPPDPQALDAMVKALSCVRRSS